MLEDGRAWIASCYCHDDVEQIVTNLKQRSELGAQNAAQEMAGKSPMSLKVALRALLGSRAADLEHALEMEYRLAMAFMRTHDFREGVRAAVVDKDRNPVWSPAALSDVSPAMVDRFFEAPNYGGLGLTAN